jgi:hypothetical protein
MAMTITEFPLGITAEEESKCDVHTLWAIETDFSFLNTRSTTVRGAANDTERSVSFIARLSKVDDGVISGLEKFSVIQTTKNRALLEVAPFVCATILFKQKSEAVEKIQKLLAFCTAIEISNTVNDALPAVALGKRGITSLYDTSKNPSKVGDLGSLIAIVDDGIPYKSPIFKGRFLRIWNQEQNCILEGAALAGPFEDESYDIHTEPALARRVSHGAHMLSIFAAPMPPSSKIPANADSPPSWADKKDDIAATAKIIGVQLPQKSVEDTSGRWLGTAILNSLHFICSHFELGYSKIVLSMSYGHTTGSHDGTSLIEQAMDAIWKFYTKNGMPMLYMCLPAGNSFSAQCFASKELNKDEHFPFTWRVLPEGRKATFLEIWFKGEVKPGDITLSVTSPFGEKIHLKSETAESFGFSANRNFAYLKQHKVLNGKLHCLIGIAPTESVSDAITSPSGDWLIEVMRKGEQPVVCCVYVARSTPHMHFRRNGTLSYLVDGEYDQNRYLKAQVGDPVFKRSLVLRHGSINGLASGMRPLVASGYRLSDLEHVQYSSAGGPNNNGSATVAFPTDESPMLPGIRASGNRSSSSVRLVGTSTAAPQHARVIINTPGVYVTPRKIAVNAVGVPVTACGLDKEPLMPLA